MDNLRTANRALATPFSLAEAAPASAGVYPQGDYDAMIAYKQGDLVILDGVAYLSLADANENNPPDSSPNFWEALGGGGGSGLPTASGADQVPLSTGAGTTYTARTGNEAVDALGATRKTLTQSILGATFRQVYRFYAPVSTVVPFGSLSSMDNPLATMIYNSGAKTLTGGVNADVTGFGLTLGMSVLFPFTQGNFPQAGVYVVTNTGADDPGGHPAVFTRRADFDSSGDILRGACIPVDQDNGTDEPGTIYRLQGNGPFTLDVSNLVFVEQAFARPTTVTITTTNAGSGDGYVILGDATGGSINVQLQAAANSRGPIMVKKIDASGNTVTILPDAPGETIDGATSKVLSTQYAGVTLYCDGARWWTFGG